jgi:hypothetical protein
VVRPADRIAHYLSYTFEKAASQRPTLSDTVPSVLFADHFIGRNNGEPALSDEEARALLTKLAAAEKYINQVITGNNTERDEAKLQFVKTACVHSTSGVEFTDTQLGVFNKVKPDALFELFAKRAAYMPFLSFCAYIEGKTIDEVRNDPVIKCAYGKMDTLFNDMIEDPISGLEQEFSNSAGVPVVFDSSICPEVMSMVDMVEREFSIKPEIVRERAMKLAYSQFRQAEKSASDNSNKQTDNGVSDDVKLKAKVLAQAYGHYKIATTIRIQELFGRNYIDAPQHLLISFHNRNN